MAAEIEEQHPIPQDISSYQFRLVGDMTLKQFIQVAAGAIAALLFYASPLHPVIKWPAAIFSFLFGIALAFMPLEDRPLATWILVFFKSIYSPTLFIWKKTVRPIAIYQPEAGAPPVSVPAKADQLKKLPPAEVKEEKISGTVFMSDQESAALTKLETKEQNFLQRISELFNLTNLMGKGSLPKIDTPQKKQAKPAVSVPEPITVTVVPEKERVKPQEVKPKAKPKNGEDREVEKLITEVQPTLTQAAAAPVTQSAQFSSEAAPPMPPTQSNVIVGQVLDQDRKIIEAAILEIKDEDGRPVRALKTNKLGHFMIVTPLINGSYEIETEKEDYQFNRVAFKAEGKIIPPISIVAKSVIEKTDSEPMKN